MATDFIYNTCYKKISVAIGLALQNKRRFYALVRIHGVKQVFNDFLVIKKKCKSA